MFPSVELPLGRALGLALLLAAAVLAAWNPRLKGWPPGRTIGAGLLVPALVLLLLGPGGSVELRTYGLFLGAGALAGFAVAAWGVVRRGFSFDVATELAILGVVGAVIGSRLVYVVQFHDEVFAALPPAVATPGPQAPLLPGETLLLRSPRGEARVELAGGEDLAALEARIAASASPLGLELRPLVARHRGPEGIETRVRGLVIRCPERGPEAFLAVDGTAREKLALPAGRVFGQPARPWSAYLDLRDGGLVYLGAVLGLFLLWAGWIRYRSLALLPLLDGVALLFTVGAGIGRWGCLAAGCCWGREAGPRAAIPVEYPPFSPAWLQMAKERLTCEWDPVLAEGVLHPELADALGPLAKGTPPLHATPVYESIGLLTLSALVLWHERRFRPPPGQSFALVVLGTTAIRFADEHLRRDHEKFFLGLGYPLTLTQVGYGVFFLLGLGLLLWTRSRSGSSGPTASSEAAASSGPAASPGLAP